jgi:hypothetical protein
LRLRFLHFWLILDEGEIDVVILRFASNAKATCLEAGEKNSH